MSNTMANFTVQKLAESRDQRSDILRMLGDTSDIQMFGAFVVVATYIEPEKTSGGLILPQKRIEESRWQGKAGLLVAMGPSAFKYDGGYEYEGEKPAIGDWVIYFPHDGREFTLRGLSCRMLHSELIRGKVSNPQDVF